jgi:hypothetical protein
MSDGEAPRVVVPDMFCPDKRVPSSDTVEVLLGFVEIACHVIL